MLKKIPLAAGLALMSACDAPDELIFSVETAESNSGGVLIVANASAAMYSECTIALNSADGGFRDFELFSLGPSESHISPLVNFQNQRREFPLVVQDALVRCSAPYIVELHKKVHKKKSSD